MSDKLSLSIPKPNFGSIIEGVIDFIIIAAVFSLASDALLAKEVDIQDQPVAFVMVLGLTAIAVKWCLSTKIWKRG
jgi:hypothetical protein